MEKDQAIFIFTKDRPLVLKKTLACLRGVNQMVFLIDDSLSDENRHINQSLLSDSQFYLGKQEFDDFLRSVQIDLSAFSFLLCAPGSNGWSLGFMRNFAMLYARHKKFIRILFMDDDIMLEHPNIIKTTLQSLDIYKLVGAEITGLVDDSILGHIATGMNIHNIRTLSGGFMAFNPLKTSNYFLNNYNEDWIWIFLEAADHEVLMTGQVSQALADPMKHWEEKIMFQEFGEIILDGVIETLKTEQKEQILISIAFWTRMLEERIQYLGELHESATRTKDANQTSILDSVLTHFDFKASTFSTLFIEYFSNKRLLKPLLESI